VVGLPGSSSSQGTEARGHGAKGAMEDSIPKRCDLAHPGYQGSRHRCVGSLMLRRCKAVGSGHGPGIALLRCILALRPPLERVPIKWNHLIDKDSLKVKDLEHEKVEQLFLDML
jgi:hypothetical protein